MKIITLSGLFFLFYLSLARDAQDVYEDLWTKSMDIANQTLSVDFLRQMRSNSLQAERYVFFTLQDINYALNVTNMLSYMMNRSQEDDKKAFFAGRYTSYKRFLDSLITRYSFKGEPPITTTAAMEKYLAAYKQVMSLNDTIYFAVALLPCSRLWGWLADNMNMPSTNAYYTWQQENKGGHPEKHFKPLLDKYLNTSEKINLATDIFRMQMTNEYDFFNTS